MFPGLLISYGDNEFASRFGAAWLPVGLFNTTTPMPKVREFLFQATNEDIARFKPSVIVFDDSHNLAYRHDQKALSLLELFLKDKCFNALLSHYRFHGRFLHHLFYTLNSPLKKSLRACNNAVNASLLKGA